MPDHAQLSEADRIKGISMRRRLFWILWLAGMAGILSFLLVDLPALIAAIPQPPGEPPAGLPPPALLKLLSLAQSAVLMTLGVLAGVCLAGRIGLHSPAAEAWAQRGDILAALKPQLLLGAVAGLASGVAVVACWVVVKPFLAPEFIARAQDFNALLPHFTRFLYGGFTEEILLRWGLMTVLVWTPWRFWQKGVGRPKTGFVVTAIVVSALMFGAGHLPLAAMLAGGLTLAVTLYVVIANSIFGIVAGVLYWRRGLEAAIIAHIFVHVVLIVAIELAV